MSKPNTGIGFLKKTKWKIERATKNNAPVARIQLSKTKGDTKIRLLLDANELSRFIRELEKVLAEISIDRSATA